MTRYVRGSCEMRKGKSLKTVLRIQSNCRVGDEWEKWNIKLRSCAVGKKKKAQSFRVLGESRF